MNVRTGAIAVGLVVIVTGGALMLGDRIASQRVAALADRGIALLPPGIEAKYQGVSCSLLTDVATVTGLNLTSRYNGVTGTETIDRIEEVKDIDSLGYVMENLEDIRKMQAEIDVKFNPV